MIENEANDMLDRIYYYEEGETIFAEGSYGDEMYVILEGKVVPIQERDPAVPAALAGVIDRSLAPDPDARHASAAEFRKALLAAAGS